MDKTSSKYLNTPQIDVSLFNKYALLSVDFKDISKDLDKFNQCTFYYDETNNIRKLWLKDDNFNAPIEKDFVLGGVMHFGDKITLNLENLKQQIRLQKSANEIKFKHISKAFFRSLGRG